MSMENEHIPELKKLFQEIPSGIAIYEAISQGQDFTVKDINPAGERLSSVKRDNVIGKSVLKAFPDVKEFGLFEVFQRVWKTGESELFPVSLYKDGAISKWFKNYIYKTSTGDIVAIYEDLTEAKQLEEASVIAKDEYKLIFDSMPFIIFTLDDKGKLVYSNRYVEDITGHTLSDFKDKIFTQFKVMGAKDIVKGLKNFKLNLKGEITSPTVYEISTKKRDKILIELIGIPLEQDGKVVKVLITGSDVTARHKADQELKSSQERLKILFDCAPDGIYLNDFKGAFVDGNKAAEKLIGSSAEEMIGKSFLTANILSKNQALKATGLLAKNILGLATGPDEFILTRKDGTQVIAEISTFPVKIEGHFFSLGVARDITDRKRVNEEIKSLATFPSENPSPVMRISSEGILLYANAASMSILDNYNLQEGKKVTEFWKTTVCDVLEANVSHVKEIEIAGKVFSFQIVPFKESGYVTLYGRDITEQRNIEKEVMTAHKIESVGVLAGGIAHDFNNLLTGILANINLAQMHISDNEDALVVLSNAQKGCIKAANLTQQLLTFSKGGLPVKELSSLGSILEDTANFALRGSSVKLEFISDKDLWAVEVDPGQFSQAVQNLVINANQAMPGGGIISIIAENIDSKSSGVTSLKPGKYVKMTVSDQGIGIADEYLNKIFDPYFTTKQEGNGLGLASTYSIVMKHGGHITVDSILGKGTAFHIYLPSLGTSYVEKEIDKKVIFKGTGSILVMDDDKSIRDSLGQTLGSLGYSVKLVSNGEEAIAAYNQARDKGEPFFAVLLDLTIHGSMGGKETIKKLLDIDPGIKAIVSSGYSNDPVMTGYKDYGFSAIISKPYDIADLSKILHRL